MHDLTPTPLFAINIVPAPITPDEYGKVIGGTLVAFDRIAREAGLEKN